MSVVIAVPSTPLVLTEIAASDRPQIDELRRAVAAALEDLRGAERIVAVAAGPRTTSFEGTGVVWDLGGIGRPDLAVSSTVALPGVPADADMPAADVRVLALLARRVAPAVAMLEVADDTDTRPAAQAISAWEPDAVLVAGDLAAGHGAKPPRPAVGDARSAAYDDAVVAALEDRRALAALADGAAEHGARGIPALQVAVELAASWGLSLRSAQQNRPVGVGGVIARWA